MTNIEMTKLCADAMGLTLLPAYRKGTILYDEGQHDWNGLMYSKDGDREYLFVHSGAYDPLHDDEQAMALMKKLRLRVAYNIFVGCWVASTLPDNETGDKEARFDESLNAAIVKCAAQAQAKVQDCSAAARDGSQPK